MPGQGDFARLVIEVLQRGDLVGRGGDGLLATFTLRPPPAPSLETITLVCPFVMLSSSTGIYPWLPFSLLSLQIYGVALLSDPGGSAANKLAKMRHFGSSHSISASEVGRRRPPAGFPWEDLGRILGRLLQEDALSGLLPLTSSPLPLWHQQDFASAPCQTHVEQGGAGQTPSPPRLTRGFDS